jgi:hypothetical protein
VRWLALFAVAACSSGSTPPDGRGAPATASPLPEAPPPPAYPADVTSLRLRRSITVRFLPDKDAKSLGTVAENTRAGWKRASAGPGCDRWIEIEPRGWICDKYLEPSKKAPVGVEMPKLEEGEVVPGEYGRVTAQGAKAFAGAKDVLRGKVSRTLAGAVTVRKMDEVVVGGRRYWKTSSGELIAADKIAPHKPSTFEGVRDPAFPLAWAQSRKDLTGKVAVRGGPGAADPIVAKLAPRTLLVVLATEGDVARVAEGWVRLADLHVARTVEPPEEIGAEERWIDVDLDEQVLTAYEGRKPAYATLVSTGKPKYPTPEGIYRIWLKYDETDMNGQMGDEQPYSVATVPWTMFFARDLGFHTAYWHDRFGEARSHGCVNLAPRDARWLYFWASPDVPAGWSMVQGIVERPGSVVRIRSAKVPVPEHRGYARFVVPAGPAPARDGNTRGPGNVLSP